MPHPQKPGFINRIRLGSGAWRGRSLDFPDENGLRPTGNRIRETLFNWLAPHIQGARCLDLFAGSGALGFEAASRGAETVTMVESSKAVVTALQKSQALLKANNVSILNLEIPKQTLSISKPFDIVFVDPPFEKKMVLESLAYLQKNNYVHAESLVFFEVEQSDGLIIPKEWRVIHDKVAGVVRYGLVARYYEALSDVEPRHCEE